MRVIYFYISLLLVNKSNQFRLCDIASKQKLPMTAAEDAVFAAWSLHFQFKSKRFQCFLSVDLNFFPPLISPLLNHSLHLCSWGQCVCFMRSDDKVRRHMSKHVNTFLCFVSLQKDWDMLHAFLSKKTKANIWLCNTLFKAKKEVTVSTRTAFTAGWRSLWYN